MSFSDIYSSISAGGVAATLLILMTLVQIAPLKINPWTWLGDQFNKNLEKKIEEVSNNQKVVEKKLDNHIAQSYRNKIFALKDKLLKGGSITQEEFDECIDACGTYERYCKDNDIDNDKAVESIKYIKRQYRYYCDHKMFSNLPPTSTDGDGK